ncbi:MAG: hypothetical protein IJ468_12375 [Lachnospiraceae bacterium]|nr:hypothetical protein [Lachnospiraceae bacterium]
MLVSYEELLSEKNLIKGWESVVRHGTPPGIDQESIHEFDQNLLSNLRRIQFEADYGIYRVQPAKMIHGKKEIALVTIADKIVANCLADYLRMLTASCSIAHNYGYLEGRSIFQAIDYIQSLLPECPYGYRCDIGSFFPSINRERMVKTLSAYITDRKILELMEQFIRISVYRNGRIEPGEGLILGSPLSPGLSNLYLYETDRHLETAFSGYARYSDDMIFLEKTPLSSEQFEWINRQFEMVGVSINQQKSKPIDEKQSFTFLGHVFRNSVRESCAEKDRNVKVYTSGYEKKKGCEGTGQWKNVQEWKTEYFNYLNCSAKDRHKTELLKILSNGKVRNETENQLTEYMLRNGLYLLLDSFPESLRESEGETTENDICEEYRRLFLKEEYQLYHGTIDAYGIHEYEELLDKSRCRSLLEDGLCLAINPCRKGESDLYVIDLDIDKRLLLEHGEDYQAIQQLKLRLRTVAFTLQKLFQDAKIVSYVEDSGYKGFHVWLFWEERISVEKFWNAADPVLQKLNLPSGCHLERIPFSGEELIKLPLSIHMHSRRRAQFITLEEDTVDQIRFMKAIQMNRNELLGALWGTKADYDKVQIDEEKEPGKGGRVDSRELTDSVYQGCAVVRALSDKAKRIHYLTHYERNALLYVYGHLGPSGHSCLHQLMRETINYSQEITQKYLDRIREFPVSCEKLTKRFPELPCTKCEFREYPLYYPSPVIHAIRKNPEEVTKPDYVNNAECKKHLQECLQPNRIDELKTILTELGEQKRKLEQDIETCRHELELLIKDGEKKEENIQKEFIFDESGIYIRLV